LFANFRGEGVSANRYRISARGRSLAFATIRG
jgi:hypothetical protein